MTNQNAANTEPWTIMRLLQWTTEHLKKSGSSSPRLDAEVLLSHARNCQRIELYTAFNEEPPEEVKAKFRELIKRRAQGEPVAYLVGKKEFYSLSFQVAPGCLIPRSETEHLVIECLDRAKAIRQSSPSHSFQIADVCTGSGCVAVSIAKHLESAKIVAIDLSEDALEIAKTNVNLHGLADRIELRQGDLLNSIDNESLDFIVSNPPYVSESEYSDLDRSVKNYEPKIALVSGESGMELIEQLAVRGPEKLRPSGWFLCELSPMIADRSLEFIQGLGTWKNESLVKDLAGNKRILIAQKA
ncbi:MAG: peptide chain release factor N(5)-glutamine methyltransferase [Pirellula sp.]|jgi:release factor glutamine methyltransferase|nr:peptide chain release factor N(5)-glutamine methyltransferase [Pirellula sp.]